MVECGRRAPALGGVAVLALLVELPRVGIAVAVPAITLQPEVGVLRIGGSTPHRRGVADELGPVALPAVEIRVLAVEPPARFAMIESSLPVVSPPDERDIPSLVLDVTLSTRIVTRPRVQTAPRVYPRCQRSVAGKTLRRRHALADLVASRAVLDPLEVRVTFVQ